MKGLFNKLDNFIEKIGKQNFILITFLIVAFIVFGLYQTFSLYTSSDGVSIIDNIKTLKFILNANNTENSVTIAAGGSKNIAITVSNEDDINLKYGIYYSSSNDLDDIEIGYKHDTDHLPVDIIEKNSDYIVTIKIENNTDSNVTINFGIIFGLENGGDLELDSNKYFIENRASYPLSEVENGSYVKYIGNNGCTGASCQGQNANYVSDTNMGYCYNSDYKFNVNGWRVMAKEDDNVYLISAGATDCMCTNSDGTMSSDSCSSSEDNTIDVSYHLNNLNSVSKKYCNRAYVYDYDCNTDNVRSFNKNDFTKITNSDVQTCLNTAESSSCGYQNSLIDNGSYYWLANSFYHTDASYYIYVHWPYYSSIGNSFIGGTLTGIMNGLRPVIKLNEDIIVTGGSGTYKSPYVIENPNAIKDLSGNMNDGVSVGASLNEDEGTISTSVVSSSYIDCGLKGYQFNDNLSMAVRVKFNSINTDEVEQAIFGNWETAGFGLIIRNNRIAFSIYTNNSWKFYYSNITPELNTWYTIAVTYDGASIKMYVNGSIVEKDSSLESTDNVTGNPASSSVPIALGTNLNYTSSNYITTSRLDATYSNALIFNRVLTSEEISTNYNSIINITSDNDLLLNYDFSKITPTSYKNFIAKYIQVNKNIEITESSLRNLNNLNSDNIISDIVVKNSSNKVVSTMLDNYDVYKVTYKINSKEVTQNIVPVPNNDITLTNILPNPGFEEEVTDYYNGTIYRTTSNKRSGNYSMYINSANSQQFVRVKYGNLGTNNKKVYVRFYTIAENSSLTPGIYVYETQTNNDWSEGNERDIIWVNERTGWTFASLLTSPISTDNSYFMIQYSQANGDASGNVFFDDMLVFTLEEDVWDTFPTKAWLDKMITDFTGTKTFNFN